MGVGKPSDIVGAVLRGIDMFDCVIPTRSGRTGQAFVRGGSLNLTTDQRSTGVPRLQGANVVIGAFESTTCEEYYVDCS